MLCISIEIPEKDSEKAISDNLNFAFKICKSDIKAVAFATSENEIKMVFIFIDIGSRFIIPQIAEKNETKKIKLTDALAQFLKDFAKEYSLLEFSALVLLLVFLIPIITPQISDDERQTIYKVIPNV